MINQEIVVFEEDLKNKYSFDELLLIYVRNDVLFREEAKNDIEFKLFVILNELEYFVQVQYLVFAQHVLFFLEIIVEYILMFLNSTDVVYRMFDSN